MATASAWPASAATTPTGHRYCSTPPASTASPTPPSPPCSPDCTRRLNAPIVLIWDNLSAHLSGKTLQYTKDNTAWLTVVQLPAYAPDLNPTEGVWAHLKNTSLANLAARSLPELTHAARRGLRHIQRHPALLAGFLTHTGLTLDPTPSTP
ncbi:transposase [Saccharothrix coeruleofusca]|uniref:transposase n=1 Tax=Saccharothrix coeruleofusca TaxID=33919 RepID=UPI00227D789F|nr:transposase [Saccharothrix coeruleofusca]